MHAKDIIVSLGGKLMENATKFAMAIFRHRAGERLTLGVIWGGNEMDLKQRGLWKVRDDLRGSEALCHLQQGKSPQDRPDGLYAAAEMSLQLLAFYR